jgi:hypothetical protein
VERITTKMLLAAIALGLWGNVATSLYYMPRLIRAVGYDTEVGLNIGVVSEVLQDLVNGTCKNDKLC